MQPVGSLRSSQVPAEAARKRFFLGLLALVMAGIFLLDLLLPRNIPLLPYYFLVVVLAAGIATPRQMVPLIAEAYGLAIASGLYWRFFPSLDFITRLLGLTGVVAVAVVLAAQRCRELARRRRTEQILTLTLDHAAAGVALADAQGRIVRVNAAFCAMLGRDADTLGTLSWVEISHPDDVALERPLVAELLAGRRDSYRLRKRCLHGDGSSIWTDASVSCIRLPDGEVDFFIGQVIDISKAVESQQALARSEEHFRLLAQNASDVVLHIASDGTVLWASPSLRQILGWEPDDWIGRSIHQIQASIGVEPFAVPSLDGDGLAQLHGSREQVRSADGQLHWLESCWSPFINAAGEVDGRVCSCRIIDEVVAAEQELRRRACTDHLTALLNREEVFRRIGRLTGRNQRRGQQLAVIFCDLDCFKEINDSLGHQAGDAVLQAMAERLRSSLRATDLAARIGGDELLVALDGVRNLEDALSIAETLRQQLSEPVRLPGGEVRISASLGVALAQPEETLDDLMHRADAAMYAAKQQGRNRVVAIPPQLEGTPASFPPSEPEDV